MLITWLPFRKKKNNKWSTERIRLRFDVAAFDFAKLEDGQAEIVDGLRMVELTTQAAAKTCPDAETMLDVGCGAGLYSVRMLNLLPRLSITLTDLSEHMLRVACEQLECAIEQGNASMNVAQEKLETGIKPDGKSNRNRIEAIHGDIREIVLKNNSYDIVIAGAVLHHLREDIEWQTVFEKIYHCLKPRGCFWIVDLVKHDSDQIHELMWNRYAEYLGELRGPRYSRSTLKYIDKEDSPRSLVYQTNLLQQVGFSQVEILHANTCFASFGGIKAQEN